MTTEEAKGFLLALFLRDDPSRPRLSYLQDRMTIRVFVMITTMWQLLTHKTNIIHTELEVGICV